MVSSNFIAGNEPPAREPLAARVHADPGRTGGIFWQSARTTRQARPGNRVPRRRAADLAHITILIDSRECYPYQLAHQQASTERHALPAGHLTVRYPAVPIRFAETRPLAEDWTCGFLGAALAYDQAKVVTSSRSF